MQATELHIAGVVHFDPLCKSRLRSWLLNLAERKREPPGFVAVEWDRGIFEQVRPQREVLRQIVIDEWPHAHQAFVTTLSEAVAFEGDTHKEVFPQAETLWIDEGRTVHDSSEITKYAHRRMNIYKSLLPRDISVMSATILEFMSRESWPRAESWPYQDTARDSKFASHIMQALTNRKPDWAIAIVGAIHASDSPDRMRTLLEANGVSCKVAILKP